MEIYKKLARLHELEMNLNLEVDVAGFLGVLIERLGNNKLS